MLRFYGMALASVVIALVGCADTMEVGDGAVVPTPDAGAEPAAVLTLLSDDAVTLHFGEEAELRVRYAEQDGTPIAGATLGLALVGRANDSTLDELTTTTDADGIAVGRVVAGRVSSAFRVRVTAERAVAVHVDVSVGEAGFGGLLVDLSYTGERLIAERAVDVYARGSCDDIDTTAGPGDRSKTLSSDVSEARFFALPVLPGGESYAVVGRGRGPGGELLAWGCTDGVVVTPDAETSVEVTMRDLALIIDGTYSVEADLDATDPFASVATTADASGTAALEASGGGASFLLDGLEASLRAAGDAAAADDLAMQRVDADLDAALALRLLSGDAGPEVALQELVDLLAERARHVAVAGSLRVIDAIPSWTMSAVTVAGTDPLGARLPLDLAALGVVPDVAMSATWLLEEDAMQLEELRIDLPLGSVGVAILAALAAEARIDGVAALMLPSSGCATFQAWATEQPVITAACSGDCLLTACKNAIEDLAASVETGLSTLDESRSVVTVMGRVSLTDTEGDLRVDSMHGDALTGQWAPADGTAGDGVAGVLSGARIIE